VKSRPIVTPPGMSRNSMISHEKSDLKEATFRVQLRPRQMAAFPLTFSALRAFGMGSRLDAISH
jgi:hypothetical protein